MSQSTLLDTLLANPETPELAPLAPNAEIDQCLAPAFAASEGSASLIASRVNIRVRNAEVEIPKFLFLGQRGGARPIRLGLFAGFDAGQLPAVNLLAGVLQRLRGHAGLARDFALVAYPVVNPMAFHEAGASLAPFEVRYAKGSADADVRFFLNEFRQWAFDGLLTLRVSRNATGLKAVVRSQVVAAEVVEPSVAAAGEVLQLAPPTVRVRSEDRYARAADACHGRLLPPADLRPYPFEIDLTLPLDADADRAGEAVYTVLVEVMRNYRRLIAHAQNI